MHVDGIVSCRGAHAGTGTSDRLDAPAPELGLTGIVDLALALDKPFAVSGLEGVG